jgi:hypothetical protein
VEGFIENYKKNPYFTGVAWKEKRKKGANLTH